MKKKYFVLTLYCTGCGAKKEVFKVKKNCQTCDKEIAFSITQELVDEDKENKINV